MYFSTFLVSNQNSISCAWNWHKNWKMSKSRKYLFMEIPQQSLISKLWPFLFYNKILLAFVPQAGWSPEKLSELDTIKNIVINGSYMWFRHVGAEPTGLWLMSIPKCFLSFETENIRQWIYIQAICHKACFLKSVRLWNMLWYQSRYRGCIIYLPIE